MLKVAKHKAQKRLRNIWKVGVVGNGLKSGLVEQVRLLGMLTWHNPVESFSSKPCGLKHPNSAVSHYC